MSGQQVLGAILCVIGAIFVFGAARAGQAWAELFQMQRSPLARGRERWLGGAFSVAFGLTLAALGAVLIARV